jgi:hypothetical protein
MGESERQTGTDQKNCKKLLIVGWWLQRGCATGMGGPAACRSTNKHGLSAGRSGEVL